MRKSELTREKQRLLWEEPIMARDYACYSDGWDDENHMADDYFDSRPDYREKNRRRVDRIIENFDGQIWENREKARRNKGY